MVTTAARMERVVAVARRVERKETAVEEAVAATPGAKVETAAASTAVVMWVAREVTVVGVLEMEKWAASMVAETGVAQTVEDLEEVEVVGSRVEVEGTEASTTAPKEDSLEVAALEGLKVAGSEVEDPGVTPGAGKVVEEMVVFEEKVEDMEER